MDINKYLPPHEPPQILIFNRKFAMCARALATVIITVIRLARPRAPLSLNVIPRFPRVRARLAYLFNIYWRKPNALLIYQPAISAHSL